MDWVATKQGSITTGNNDFSVDVRENARIKKVNLSVPAAQGDVTFRIYNGVVGDNKPITEALYLAAGGEIDLNDILDDSDGKLGIRIAGWTSGGTTAYVNVGYEL